MALVKRAVPGRKAVLNRILAGLGGGYLLAAAAAAGLAAILPMPRIEAVVTAQIAAYVLFVMAALAAFLPRKGATAWAIILLPAAMFALAGWLGGGR
ncbi:hypothetical protein FHW96_000162 [Novosphingobium sp. SG751A]|uniref:hypothetical protein n=1 Tax=Novosphingobium sp. SG751A TaxID=2587000 RepID=UPI001C12B016|nr:hypothetical protein [Novosphingobium sp. SG751A]NOW44035.1 hypothetical protein [Novosphingobium sp. SG751A]